MRVGESTPASASIAEARVSIRSRSDGPAFLGPVTAYQPMDHQLSLGLAPAEQCVSLLKISLATPHRREIYVDVSFEVRVMNICPCTFERIEHIGMRMTVGVPSIREHRHSPDDV